MKPKNSYLRDTRQGVALEPGYQISKHKVTLICLGEQIFFLFFWKLVCKPGSAQTGKEQKMPEKLASIKGFLAEVVGNEMRFIKLLSDHEHHLHHRSRGRRTSGCLPKLM